MPTFMSPYLLPVLLLIGSNIFMTIAWYGHLRFKETPLLGVILASWGIALVEYCMAVPANRWGSAVYTTAQLKTMQEVITLVVFAGFSVFYLKEAFTWNHAVGFALIAGGVFCLSRAALKRGHWLQGRGKCDQSAPRRARRCRGRPRRDLGAKM
jgi:uncharacterized protein (DUF486 family)